MSLKSVKLLRQNRLFERFLPMRLLSTKTPKDFTSGPLNSSQEGSDDQSGKMRGWQIHEYGGVEILQCSNNIKIPTITSPNEVCVEVHTASVNPIDVAMMGGYGSTLLNVLRCNNTSIEFPLTLGRDFCGVITRKGMNVREDIQIGDKVYGCVPPHRSGCHAEYVVVDESCIAHKPETIDDIEAAGVLYAGLTAWSGLYISGHIGGVLGALTSQGGGQGKRICILGASGGVGSIATQIAKAENLKITATCSTDSIQMVRNLGADHVIDYTSDDVIEQFRDLSFDLILDCAGLGTEYATKVPWKFDQYITFSSPMLRSIDSNGIGMGFFKNIVHLLESNIQSISKYRGLSKWAYFVAAPQGIEYLSKQVERNKIAPIVDSVYDFDATSDAYQRVANGHLRGKVILKIK